jgi:hypothetical protein
MLLMKPGSDRHPIKSGKNQFPDLLPVIENRNLFQIHILDSFKTHVKALDMMGKSTYRYKVNATFSIRPDR